MAVAHDRLAAEVMIDYLDMSLWDAAKEPAETEHQGRSLFSWFTDLPRDGVRLGAAGKIMSARAAASLVEGGADFALIGRAAILHHDFATRALADPAFAARPLPVTLDYLAAEGLGARFLRYITTFEGFVAPATATAA